MKFKDFLLVEWVNPDIWFSKPGAIIWEYFTPHLYWYDPKKKSFMRDNKAVKVDPNKWFVDVMAKDPVDFAQKGHLTHRHLENAFGLSSFERTIRGRVSPDRKKFARWSGPETREFAYRLKGAEEALYKYIIK